MCSACQKVFSGDVLEVDRSNFNGILLRGFAVSQYSKPAATMVHELKEKSQTFLAVAMAKPMAKALTAEFARNGYSSSVCLIPMPSKRASFEKRGFNPSLLLAKKICDQLRKENFSKVQVENCLKLNRNVLDQASQVGLTRRQNLVEAISLVRAPQAQEIWLVDDVVTTGSTLLEAARCLSAEGFRVAGFIVFAETLHKNQQKIRAAAN